MNSICAKLHDMVQDEASGILAYNKLKNEMPSEHKDHIETIEEYIEDEYKHLRGIYQILIDMNCPIERSEMLESKLRDITDIEKKK